jgi:hypothetical protein
MWVFGAGLMQGARELKRSRPARSFVIDDFQAT